MRRVLLAFFLLNCIGVIYSYQYKVRTDDQGWSKSYEIIFSKLEQKRHEERDNIYVEKMGISSGTELLFGWNAIRPEKAQFTFYIKLHNAITRQWSEYHKIIEWGGIRQKAFFNTTSTSEFKGARLEVAKDIIIDGFAIKITSDTPHTLQLIGGVFITVANFTQFKHEYVSSSFFQKPYICIDGVPMVSQILLMHPRAGGICSPTSTAMVTSYITHKKIDALEFADYCYDPALDIFGNWPFSTAHAYEHCYKYAYMYPMRLASIEALYNLLEKYDCPVVVSITGQLQGAAKFYPNGHLLVVIGFDPARKKIICHDPAFREIEKVRCEYDIQDFVNAWERKHRITYKVIRKK